MILVSFLLVMARLIPMSVTKRQANGVQVELLEATFYWNPYPYHAQELEIRNELPRKRDRFNVSAACLTA